jgi:hypothetical protein
MSYPSSQVETVDGIEVKATAFKTNAWFYKSIGGKVTIRQGTSRRWWCLWLCRRSDNVEADNVIIENLYYSRIEGTAIEVVSARHAGEWHNATTCTLKHWAVGMLAKIKFPGGGTTPGTVSGLLTLNGVISQATVRIKGRALNFITAAGSYPST